MLSGFEAKMLREPEVQQCYFVSGDNDYLLVVVCDDMEGYDQYR
jgi:Lrp/AsnC family leucine-responsive transcriptional regulator